MPVKHIHRRRSGKHFGLPRRQQADRSNWWGRSSHIDCRHCGELADELLLGNVDCRRRHERLHRRDHACTVEPVEPGLHRRDKLISDAVDIGRLRLVDPIRKPSPRRPSERPRAMLFAIRSLSCGHRRPGCIGFRKRQHLGHRRVKTVIHHQPQLAIHHPRRDQLAINPCAADNLHRQRLADIEHRDRRMGRFGEPPPDGRLNRLPGIGHRRSHRSGEHRQLAARKKHAHGSLTGWQIHLRQERGTRINAADNRQATSGKRVDLLAIRLHQVGFVDTGNLRGGRRRIRVCPNGHRICHDLWHRQFTSRGRVPLIKQCCV